MLLVFLSVVFVIIRDGFVVARYSLNGTVLLLYSLLRMVSTTKGFVLSPSNVINGPVLL